MIKWLYNKYKQHFIKLYLEEVKPKADFSQMEYRFTDSNGKAYYGYPKDLETSMSMDRFGYWQDFYTWFSRNMTDETLIKCLNIIDEALNNGLTNKNKKSASIIGAVSQEMRAAKDMARTSEVIYNMLACQLIREDENLFAFNNNIHMEKVDQFRFEVDNNNAFFLQMKEYIHLFASTITTPEEFLQSSKEAELLQKQLIAKLSSYQ